LYGIAGFRIELNGLAFEPLSIVNAILMNCIELTQTITVIGIKRTL